MLEIVLSVLLTLLGVFVTEVPSSESIVYETNEPVTAEVIWVIDGDTIDVRTANGEARVRYIGIDTPEPYRESTPECYSREATERNRELVEGKTVSLLADAEDTDRFGRLLRYVQVDNQFVNDTLVAEGYATTLSIEPNTTYARSLQAAEDSARENNLGLWGVCQ